MSSDTELDEIFDKLTGHCCAGYGCESDSSVGGVKEAKQKLLKWRDKEVTRNRIDELKLIPMVASKKVFVGVKAKDSLNVYLKQRLAELQTIQEEGTDNG